MNARPTPQRMIRDLVYDTLHQEGILHATTGDLLHSNEILVEVLLIETLNGVDNHVREEWLF